MSQVSKLVVNTIAQATSPYLLNPDYQKNFEVVELLTHNPDTLPVAFKYLRQQIKNDNLEVSVLGLALLETLIKNVPACHICVADAYFMQGLVKVATGTRSHGVFKSFKRKQASRSVKINMEQKALLILKSCADTYNDGRSYPIFKQTYDKLVREGVRFPEFDQNESNIIFAPDRSSADKKAEPSSNNPNDSLDNIDANAEDLPVLQAPVKIEEVSNPSLVQAQETCVLLHQMILSNQDLATNELVLSVVQQLRVSQNDIMAILNTTNNEADMAQALAVNDLIVQILFGYEEVAAGRMRREGPDKEGEESEQAAEDAPLFPDLGDAVVNEEEVEGASEPGAKKKKKKKKKKDEATLSPISPPAATKRKKSTGKAEPGLLDDLLFSTPAQPPSQTEGKDPFMNFANQFVKKEEPAVPSKDPFVSAAPAVTKSDPFSAPSTVDPFSSPASDPFASGDPFASPAPIKRPQAPFSATKATFSSANATTFSANPNPFDTTKTSDPFATSDPFKAQDPFNTPGNSDPFANANPFQANDKRAPEHNIFADTMDDPFKKSDAFTSTNMFTQPANNGYSRQPHSGFVQQPQSNFFNAPAQPQPNMFNTQQNHFPPQQNPFSPPQQQNFFQQPYQPPPDPFANINHQNVMQTSPPQNQFNHQSRKKLTKAADPFKDVDPFASI